MKRRAFLRLLGITPAAAAVAHYAPDIENLVQTAAKEINIEFDQVRSYPRRQEIVPRFADSDSVTNFGQLTEKQKRIWSEHVWKEARIQTRFYS